MPERSEKALRLLCWALGAVLLVQVAIKLVARNPLSGLKIPALPTLGEAADSSSSGKGTNNGSGHSTESQASHKGTNSFAGKGAVGTGTNVVSRPAGSNDIHVASTNIAGARGTNLLAEAGAAGSETNSLAAQAAPKGDTNSAAEPQGPPLGTNAMAQHHAGKAGTNLVAQGKSASKGTNEMAMRGGNGPMRMGGPGKRAPELPLPIQAQVDRVVDSELFGQVFHPMPPGLLGIAGNMAFLRAANGQTGAVKEGDELGGLKLLRIGINRVLVEEGGQKKELMIFEGLGGQSLIAN